MVDALALSGPRGWKVVSFTVPPMPLGPNSADDGPRSTLDRAEHLEREEVQVDDAVPRLVDGHAVEREQHGALIEAAHVEARLAAAAVAHVDPGRQIEHVAQLVSCASR